MASENEKKLLEELRSENAELRKQVEKHTREAEIQLALERVRARTMAMQESEELAEASAVLFEQMKLLGVTPERMTIGLVKEDSNELEMWLTDQDGMEINDRFTASLDEPTTGKKAYEVWKKGLSSATITLTGDELSQWIKYVREEMNMDFREDLVTDRRVHTLATFAHGMLITSTPEPLPDESIHLMERFAKVFSLTYTRFLDLKKAEEQARKAKEEASLEKVRAKGMAMHSTDDIEAATVVFFNELSRLGIQIERCGIALMDDTSVAEVWSTTLSRDNREVIDIVTGHLDFKIHPMLMNSYQFWEKNKEFSAYTIKGTELLEYYDKLERQPEYQFPKADSYPEQQILQSFYFNAGAIFLYTIEELSIEEIITLKRFAKVFEQTYTRFLDLQKAEEQAREAKIEAALERVRSRSMGMQKSEDLQSVVNTLYGEFQLLHVDFDVAIIQIIPDDSRDLHLWVSTADGLYEDIVHWPFIDIPIFHHIYEARTGDKTLEYSLDGDEVSEFLEEYYKLEGVPSERKDATRDVNIIEFAGKYQKYTGIILVRYTEGSFSALEKKIISRFSKVFEQTYTRFLDIKRAEKLAVETARQSSLDRIRAEIASMRNSEDMEQITPLIWDELNTLEIPFIRCGVFIMDEENDISHTYLSTAQGEPIAALQLPEDDFPLVEKLFTHWKNNEIYTEHWDQEDFRNWTQNLIDGGFISSKKKYEAGSIPETLDLHFLPFKHGMLYIGNTEPLSKEHLDLGQSMTDAFSVAYDRYEDFNKLEQAKQKIEEAFRELEAAQDQLVQQEKLASLGQLTAGIAHEIKNPLNFVNNFSEVSIEMLDEVREEVKEKLTADSSQLTAIINDIEVNLRKIHEHGTRADGIVKSMLQHSRGGSGEMKPVPVNSLIKEYTNLAFHGMRAAKNPINVDIELDLDENVGEANLITEDFSRVIVNLCNNAFDAMREKVTADGGPATGKKVQAGDTVPEYIPKLTVRTQKKDRSVLIQIEDNGPGIPDEIKDKILQPFFTTKKGTAGTGLGLSITNDIIKAHGGELNIESKKDAYTRFSIHLLR